MYKITVEVIEVNHDLFEYLQLEMVNMKNSRYNKNLDVTLVGSRTNLLHYLREYLGEGKEYFNKHAEKN